MRGSQGPVLSICGDWLYDWAKLYQSLIGYDEILDNINLDYDYKNDIIKYFVELFLEKFSDDNFSNLKIITKSLLFSLIPLHDDDKCDKYYKLIFSKYL
jgi:hypothetical protein